MAELRGAQAVLVTVLEWCDLNSLNHVLRRRSARLAGGSLSFDQSYVRVLPTECRSCALLHSYVRDDLFAASLQQSPTSLHIAVTF